MRTGEEGLRGRAADARAGALASGLDLARTTLQILVNDVSAKTRIAAERAGDTPERLQLLALERLREQLAAQSVALLSSSGQVMLSAGGAMLPDRPTATMMRQARHLRVFAQLEGLDADPPPPGESAAPPRVRAIAWVPSTTFSLTSEDRYLQVTQLVPAELAANALRVQTAYSEYQQRALGRDGLRKMYIGTLTLTLILGIFSALLMAAGLGHQIGRPLVMLAEGVRQVASGDLRPTAVFASRDELGGLTRAFAGMTQQLADARGLVQRSLAEVESAKTHLQTILDNLTSGVIVFDAAGTIMTANPGATRILRQPPPWSGRTGSRRWRGSDLQLRQPSARRRGWRELWRRRKFHRRFARCERSRCRQPGGSRHWRRRGQSWRPPWRP